MVKIVYSKMRKILLTMSITSTVTMEVSRKMNVQTTFTLAEKHTLCIQYRVGRFPELV